MEQYTGLIDCNNFFVSCERVFRPDLWKRPVVVLSSNDGCVVARSQEVKDKGVPMAVPYFQVKDILSDMGTVVFSSHFSLYRDLSRRVFSLVEAEVGEIEKYSIDECFFTLEASGVEARMNALRQRIWQSIGIPVSIGIAPSKTIAKCANDQAKQTNGFQLITPMAWQTMAAVTPLSTVWGVGRGLSSRFRAAQLDTVAEYAAQPLSTIQSLFGVVGTRLWHEVRGEVALPVTTKIPTPQSFTSSRSFAKSVTDKVTVRSALSYHLYQVVVDMVRTGTLARAIRIVIAPSRFAAVVGLVGSAEVVLDIPSNDILVLEKLITQLFERLFTFGVAYKKAGVTVLTTTAAGQTPDLFTNSSGQASITSLLMSINERVQQPVVGVGMVPRLGVRTWEGSHKWRSPDYTTRWEDVCEVSAR